MYPYFKFFYPGSPESEATSYVTRDGLELLILLPLWGLLFQEWTVTGVTLCWG